MSEKSLKERFQEKLDGSRWTGSTNNIGYPKMKVDGEMVLGSHVALRLAGRKAPTGGPAGGNIVMHKDNNKLNLSPSNLEVGTHKENLKQMRDEGRDRPRGVHQEPDEKTARVRGPVKAMRRAMELLQDGSTAYHTSSSYNVSRAAEDRLLKAGRGQVHGKGVYFQLGKPADMYGSAAVAIPGSHAGGLKALPPAVDGVAGPDYWRMHQGDNFPLPSKAVLVGSGYYGAHPTTIASADLEMRSAARKGRLRHIGVGPWEAALDASEKVASTDIDILKFAFKLQDAKSVAQAVKSKIVKPGHAVAAGPSYLPRHAEALGDATRIGKAMGLPRGVTTAAVQETMQNVGNLGGRITWPRKGDATSFLRHGMEEEGAGLQHASEYLKDLPTSVTAQLQASVQHNKDKLNALRSVRSPADRQIMDGLIKSHELAEATVRPQMGFAHFGHRSPKVILQEQNAVATLPPGSTVGPAMTALRRGKESEVLKSVGVDYGAKRYSRHAVKHLSNDIEQASLKQFKDAYPDGKIAFKLQGHAEFQGIQIAIENRKGSVRKGTDKDGKPWRTVMRMPYGFVKGTKGADGEEIDCYIGPHKNAPNVYAVHQHKSDGTGYDEDKLIFGVRSKEEATKGYLAHYNSDKFLGPVKEVPVERLKEMLSTGKKLEKISTSLCARVLRRG